MHAFMHGASTTAPPLLNASLLAINRYDVPLVADIHFQPAVAMMVAEAFEKIRVNPGNFADGRKTFEVINYDDPAQFRRRAGADPRGAYGNAPCRLSQSGTFCLIVRGRKML